MKDVMYAANAIVGIVSGLITLLVGLIFLAWVFLGMRLVTPRAVAQILVFAILMFLYAWGNSQVIDKK